MKNKNLYVYQNSIYSKNITIKNDDASTFNLTGYTLHIVISKHFESMPKYQFPVTVINNVTGSIQIQLSDVDTTSLPTGSLVYSLWGTHSLNGRQLLLQGTIFVESTVFEELV